MSFINRLRPEYFRTLLAILLITAGALSAACSDPEKAKAEHLRQGEVYLKEKKFQEASIEFRNALQIDDNLAAAHYGLAQAYEGLERFQDTVEELYRTIQLDASNMEARVKMGNYYMLMKPPQIDEAERLADEVLEKSPNDPEGHILKATVLYARDPQRNREAAQAELNKALAINPQRLESHLSLGNFYERTGETARAEQSYRQAVALDDKSALAHMALGGFFVRQNRLDMAEAEYRKAVEVDSANRNARLNLANFYRVTTRQMDKAEEVYKSLAELEPDKPEGRATLADFYSATGRPDDAVRVYEGIVAKSPEYTRARYRLAEIMLQRNNLEGAAKQVEAVLQKNGRDLPARLLRARISLQNNKTKEAIDELKEVLDQDPRDGVALFTMAEAQLRAGKLDEARVFAGDLEKFYPDFLPAKLTQAQINLAAGDLRTAQRHATELLDRVEKSATSPMISPQLLSELQAKALVTRGAANLQAKDYRAARADLERVRNIAPNAPGAYTNLAAVAFAEGKLDEAMQHFERALQLDPANFEALSGLVRIYGAQRRFDQAHARLDQAIAARANDPALHFLKAQVYGAEGNAPGSEGALRRALEVSNGQYLPAYESLAALYINTKQPERAIAEFQKVAERQPENAMAYTMIGMAEYSRNNLDAAVENYKRALAIDPATIIAANNLAMLYADHDKGNLDEAVRLAQGIVQRQPDVPGFIDTLGWVYYKKGLHAAAIEQLQRALDKARANKADSALYRYHLGMALAGAGRRTEARRELETALRLADEEAKRSTGPTFTHADEARRALANL